MVRIPTPIPQHWVDRLAALYRAPTWVTVWRLVVIGVFSLIVYLMATSPVFIIAFLGATTAGLILADDVQQTVTDVWNLDFWVWRVDR